jgi:hypothetical protein
MESESERIFWRSQSRKEFYVESESEGIFWWSRSRKEFYVESESEGIFRWSRGRKEFLGGVGVLKIDESESKVCVPTPQSCLYHVLSFCRFFTQGCTNPGWKVSQATKFCTVVPNIYGSPVWNLICVTLLAPRILTWLPGFCKICGPLFQP